MQRERFEIVRGVEAHAWRKHSYGIAKAHDARVKKTLAKGQQVIS
jgi:hypothetical protein